MVYGNYIKIDHDNNIQCELFMNLQYVADWAFDTFNDKLLKSANRIYADKKGNTVLIINCMKKYLVNMVLLEIDGKNNNVIVGNTDLPHYQ